MGLAGMPGELLVINARGKAEAHLISYVSFRAACSHKDSRLWRQLIADPADRREMRLLFSGLRKIKKVHSMLISFMPLLAEAGAGNAGSSSGGLIMMLTLWIPLIIVFYFLLIRPERKERARRQAMLNALKKNDRVLTIGGIYGVVTNVHREANEVTIRVDDANNTRIRCTLSAIAQVLGEETPSEKQKEG